MASTKHTVITRPVARSERLLVESVGTESVIYDQDTNVAHALQPLAASVFMYADGTHTVAEIAELVSYRLEQQITEAQAHQAIEELSALELLDTPNDDRSGLSRRDALKVFSAVGAGTMLVSSVAAPFASASTLAANGKPYTCGTGYNGVKVNGTGTIWPQPWSDDSADLVAPFNTGGPASANGTYDLGSSCCVNCANTCTYSGKTTDGTTTTVQVPCDYTFKSDVCILGKNSSNPGAIVSGMTQTECGQGAGHKFCATPDGNGVYTYDGSVPAGGCKRGQVQMYPNSTDFWATSWTVSSDCTQGTYQCVPCDGSLGYQCCEAVCVPNGTTVVGAVTGTNSTLKPAPLNDTVGKGYSSGAAGYTTLPFAESGGKPWYPYKFCTPCTEHGNCS